MKEINKEQALELLINGNKRFESGELQHPDRDAKRRMEGLSGQNPFAVVVGCSDSRVPPEILFDQGIGDLFVIRVAGNIIDDAVIGSVEYAVKQLETPLVMVMGHNLCGAVQTAIAGVKESKYIEVIAEKIQPAIDAVSLDETDYLDKVIRKNVELMVDKLTTSSQILNNSLKSGEIAFIGGYYDIATGKFEIL
ncbi:MAG: carbonic anhydrase [Bacillota bacterium]|nr:carbonic anhydrase [Bacillota bacterium]